MKRTTMFLDGSLAQDVKRYAEQQDRSVASVVREALSMWVDAQRAVPRGRPAFVAAGRSGHADTAQRHESLVFAGMTPHRGEARPATTRAAGTPRTPARRQAARGVRSRSGR